MGLDAVGWEGRVDGFGDGREEGREVGFEGFFGAGREVGFDEDFGRLFELEGFREGLGREWVTGLRLFDGEGRLGRLEGRLTERDGALRDIPPPPPPLRLPPPPPPRASTSWIIMPLQMRQEMTK